MFLFSFRVVESFSIGRSRISIHAAALRPHLSVSLSDTHRSNTGYKLKAERRNKAREEHTDNVIPSSNNDDDDQTVMDNLEGMGKLVREDYRQGSTHPMKLKQKRFTKQIMNLIKKSKVEEANRVFEDMKRSKVMLEPPVYNSLIAGNGKKGDLRKTFSLFNEMKKRTILPTDRTYTSMFAACAKVGPDATTILDKVIAEMERRDVACNSIVNNSLITALAMCDRHQRALEVYVNMTKKSQEPDMITFGGLLLAVGKDREKGLELAQGVWSEMIASGFKPDLYSYNMLIQVLRDAGMEGRDDTSSSMENSSQSDKPKVRVVPRVKADILKKIRNSAKCETQQDAVGDTVVAEPSSVNVHPQKLDSEVASISNLNQEAHERTTLVIIGQATFTLSPDHSITVHQGCVNPGAKRERRVRWLEQHDIEILYAALKHSKVKPDIRTFHLLVHLSLEPSQLLVTMQERRVAPDNKFLEAAVRQQAQALKNLQGAEMLMEHSRLIGIDLGQAGYQALATSCNGKKEAMVLLNRMKADGLKPNEFVLGTLVGNAVRDHSYEYLTHLVKTMMHLEFMPNETIMEMMQAAANHKPKSPLAMKRHNGFKGYFLIWKRILFPDEYSNEKTMYDSSW